ncbi:hypothetical protein D187_002328 [Cystobacter fuscus DSM 2262]|uniref:Uncharacterized protein n=1 Tax=Cystobacter fuscus (strain ATCC 25194 / DSM 2262 / NBRC 100088 / M29) TaxID=1242864 RepID=S9PD72_CYSF2|nr:hypothetical protein D187_002328 [Cystobacter fuscus DSM 2262]
MFTHGAFSRMGMARVARAWPPAGGGSRAALNPLHEKRALPAPVRQAGSRHSLLTARGYRDANGKVRPARPGLQKPAVSPRERTLPGDG